MQTCICIGGLILLADGAAWVLTAQTGDSRWVVLITSGTGVIVALCTAVVMAAPHLGKAATVIANTVVTAIVPALQLIWKQREEINKGTYTEQIQKLAEQNEKLQATIEEDREATEKARKTLAEIRDEFNAATLHHQEQREALIAQLGAVTNELAKARQEIADLREHDNRLLTRVTVKQEHQAIEQKQHAAAISETQAAISENKAAIQVTAAVAEQTAAAVDKINVERSAERSGEMPAVEPSSNHERS